MTGSRNRSRVFFLVLLTASIGGCTSSGFPGQRPSAIITVKNEHTPNTNVTIHLVPSLGNPTRLGSVQQNRSRRFTIRRGQLDGSYHLWARPSGGRGFYSPEFTMKEGDVLEWDLRMNQVFLIGTTGG